MCVLTVWNLTERRCELKIVFNKKYSVLTQLQARVLSKQHDVKGFAPVGWRWGHSQLQNLLAA